MKKTISTILLLASMYAGAQTTNKTLTIKSEINKETIIKYEPINLNLNSTKSNYSLKKSFELIANNTTQEYDLEINTKNEEQQVPKQNTIPNYLQKELKEKNNYQPSVEGTIVSKF